MEKHRQSKFAEICTFTSEHACSLHNVLSLVETMCVSFAPVSVADRFLNIAFHPFTGVGQGCDPSDL
jgi:hypothetical protein